jgi:hypothetical protein
MIGLIGSTGLVGTELKKHIRFRLKYTSKTIDQFPLAKFDTLYISAPSGNRMAAAADPDHDAESVDIIIKCLSQTQVQRVVLISTVDTQHAPETPYGANRLRLEQAIKSLPKFHILRLCTLIDPNINKNILWDLKNRMYLDTIMGNTQRQYYPLNRLYNDTQAAIAQNIQEINLVSEPVLDKDIVAQFYPDLVVPDGTTCVNYNVTNKKQYTISREQILKDIAAYLND